MAPCANCGTTDPPDAERRCRCGCMRPGSSLASVHDGKAKLTPTDYAARDALRDRLFAERGGRAALDIVSQLRVDDYATAQIQLGKVTRRLEALGAVSTEGRKRSSLVDTYNIFSARVERLAAELPKPRVVAAAEQIVTVKRIIITPDGVEHDFNRGMHEPAEPSTTSTESSTTSSSTGCFQCGGGQCVGRAHPLYRTLHGADAEFVAEDVAAATEQMIAGIGRRVRGEQ